MYQTAIQELADKYSIFVTPEMLEDMNSVLTAAVPIDADSRLEAMRTEFNDLTAEVESLNEDRETERRICTDITEARDRYSRLLTAARQEATTYCEMVVDDDSASVEGANSFLASIGATRLNQDWDVEVSWGSYSIGTGTATAPSQEEAHEKAQNHMEVTGAEVRATLRFSDTDGLVWDQSEAEHEFDWDEDAEEYIEISSEES